MLLLVALMVALPIGRRRAIAHRCEHESVLIEAGLQTLLFGALGVEGASRLCELLRELKHLVAACTVR